MLNSFFVFQSAHMHIKFDTYYWSEFVELSSVTLRHRQELVHIPAAREYNVCAQVSGQSVCRGEDGSGQRLLPPPLLPLLLLRPAAGLDQRLRRSGQQGETILSAATWVMRLFRAIPKWWR